MSVAFSNGEYSSTRKKMTKFDNIILINNSTIQNKMNKKKMNCHKVNKHDANNINGKNSNQKILEVKNLILQIVIEVNA